MRKLLLTFVCYSAISFISVHLLSCSNSSEKNICKLYSDEQIDSLALIAWNGTKFGMSPDEVLALPAFSSLYIDSDLVSDEKWALFIDNTKVDSLAHSLQLDDFNLQNVILKFGGAKRNELFEVYFKFITSPENEFEYTLLPIATSFKEGFEKKYGTPNDSLRIPVTYEDLTMDEDNYFARWKIGPKEILIVMYIVEETGEVNLDIKIKNENFPSTTYVNKSEKRNAIPVESF